MSPEATATSRLRSSRGLDRQLAAIDRNSRDLAEHLRAAALAEEPELLGHLGTTHDGLTDEAAESRLARFGPNTVATDRPPHWSLQLLLSFKNPFTLTLLGLAGVLTLVGDLAGTAILVIMVSLSTLITFWQEYRSNLAADRLRAMITTTARVRRRAEAGQPPATSRVRVERVVVGDIVELVAGDLVPADSRVLRSTGLLVTQGTLTGEALPVEKTTARPSVDQLLDPPDLPNICLLGTSVVSGSATAVVLKTGDVTYLGSMAEALTHHEPDTAFDRGLAGVSWTLLRFMALMVPIVFVLNGLTTQTWAEAFQFAVAVAVGLTPEMLPVVVTANLARGALALSRREVIVKELGAIQNFGAMNVLCTDKTGTLTEDRIVLHGYLDTAGNRDDDVLEHAWLNSNLQSGLRNPLDLAISDAVDSARSAALTQQHSLKAEIPFDFERRRLTVIVVDAADSPLVITKGAIDEVLDCTTTVRVRRAGSAHSEIVWLDDARREGIEERVRQLHASGLRVLAVAVRRLGNPTPVPIELAEEGLTLIGYLTFQDPPKSSAAPAIAALHRGGVAVKVLTGDTAEITTQVCREVGIEVSGVIQGIEINQLSDDDLVEVVAENTVFAKVDPLQKARIVNALQSGDHTVGFLGDGVNDAAALREADVGISVDGAVDIAREAADIILLQKDLLVLERGVVEGRRTFGNIMKYLKLTLSSNFGNVLSLLVASAFLPFLPMRPLQLLLQNLLYDVSQLAIPFDRVDADYLRSPRRWTGQGLGRFMLVVGPVSSIFDITTFALLWYVYGANSAERQGLFQAGWFILGLLSQVLVVHLIRTDKIPFIQSRATWPVMLSSAFIMAAGALIPYTAVGTALGFVAPPASFFWWLVVTLLGYAVLLEVVKRWYVRLFGSWL